MTVILFFIIISAILIMIALILGIAAFHKRTRLGNYLGFACLGSVGAIAGYLMSALSPRYFSFSLGSSVYFASISALLLFSLHFTGILVKLQMAGAIKYGYYALCIYGIFDVIVQMINPFYEISMHYVPRETQLACYSYEMKPLYTAHLYYTYLIVAVMLALLIYKVTQVPSVYRRQYIYPILGIMVIVIANAVFLFIPEGLTLDYSVWGYPLIEFLLYWTCFSYSSHGMLNQFKGMIFDSLDQGIVLFSYEDELLLINERAEELLPELDFETKPNRADFIAGCRLSDMSDLDDFYSLQCYSRIGDTEQPIRCDYRKMKSAMDELMGHLYVLSNAGSETDVLTGFHNWENFCLFAKESPAALDSITAVAALDINALTTINSSFGRKEGDKAIQSLAEKMREILPAETYFVRGQDAILIALGYRMKEKELLHKIELVKQEYRRPIQYGIYAFSSRETDVLSAIELAVDAMNAKKLLDSKSGHSTALASLIRALEASDPDTEAHVKRTQIAGAKLGERLGLTDSEQSNLALLCLLHDIGKIGVPLEILNKPGKLSEAEWEVLKTHVTKGHQIASSAKEFRGIADMILHHHERWDGKGYPSGLSRESIPLLSRIIGIVDAYDAMTNDRSYRSALSTAEARRQLRENAGTQFDPRIVAEYLRLLEEENPASEEGISQREDSGGSAEVTSSNSGEKIGSRQVDTSRFIHNVRYSRYLLDSEMKIIEVDDSFEALTGYSMQDIQEQNMSQADLIFEEDRTEYLCQVNEQMSRSPLAFFEHRVRKKDGTAQLVFCLGRSYFDPVGRGAQTEIIITDSSDTFAMKLLAEEERRKGEKRLEQWEDKYRKDPLTGLLSHEAYKSDVETHLLLGDCKILLVMADLDKFKGFNDTYGHKAGDEYLIHVANCLRKVLRGGDIACRMGGDEFSAAVFFKPDTKDEVIHHRAKDLYTQFSALVAGYENSTGVSMGTAISGRELDSFDKLYEKADHMLYESKHNGRGMLTNG